MRIIPYVCRLLLALLSPSSSHVLSQILLCLAVPFGWVAARSETLSSSGREHHPFQPAVPLLTSTHVCPSSTPSQCTSVGELWWCCPASSRCVWDESGDPCCCPVGEVCWGMVSYGDGVTVYTTNPSTSSSKDGPNEEGSRNGSSVCYGCQVVQVHASGADRCTWQRVRLISCLTLLPMLRSL